jgi:excisionase family DNA binding protein
MEGITTVKISDLEAIHQSNLDLLNEIRQLKQIEEDAKAYTIKQAADLLNVHYCSVRKLVIKGKLFAKYLEGINGKCIIPLWSIKTYLKSKENSNQ